MSKPIDSDALDELYRTLGLAGGSERGTLLDDGNVSMVLALDRIVRRSRTPGVTDGSHYGVLQNVHGAAGQVATTIDPYAAGDDAIAPWDPVIPAGFDVWIMGAAVRRVAAAGGLDGGVLSINPLANQQGFGRDSAGAPVADISGYPIAFWDTLNTDTTFALGLAGDGSAWARLGIRLTRGAAIAFTSDAAAAATFNCTVLLGLFPAGLGQDVVE